MKVGAAKRNNTYPKGKGKVREDGLIGNKNARKQPKRFPTGGRQRDPAPWRSRSGEAKLVRSPHVWKNKFVSNMSPFSSYYYCCKRYGHTEEEYKKMSRNRKSVLRRNSN